MVKIKCSWKICLLSLLLHVSIHGHSQYSHQLNGGVHFDKDVYLPGETVYFKCYLTKEGFPAETDANLMIQIENEKGGLLSKKLFAVYDGICYGSFDLPLKDTGHLFFYAYPGSSKLPIIFRTITVTNSRLIMESANEGDSLVLSLYPEGGKIIKDVQNTVAFETVNRYGLPGNIKGKLIDSKKNIIFEITTLYAGMGTFRFTPEHSENYFIDWTDALEKHHITPIPKAVEGINLHVEQWKGDLYYIIGIQSTETLPDTAFVVMKRYGLELYKIPIILKDQVLVNGKIPVKNFPGGVAIVSIEDKQKVSLAERTVFLNESSLYKPVTVTVSPGVGKQSLHTVDILVPDTLLTNLSLSVSDALFSEEGSSSSIAQEILLNTNELRAPIVHPEKFFSQAPEINSKRLDLLMLTHAKQNKIMNAPAENETVGVTVTGQIRPLKASGKMPQQAMIWIKDRLDTTKTSYVLPVTVSANGNFQTTSLPLTDSALIYCSIGKNVAQAENYSVSISGSLDTLFRLDREKMQPPVFASGTKPLPGLSAFIALPKEADSRMLKEVIVKSKRISHIEEMDQRYSTGFFKGGINSSALDVAADSLAWASLDLYNYLSYRIRGLCSGTDIEGKFLGAGFGTRCNKEGLLVFIDEQLSSNDVLPSIDINQVAYVKFLPTYYGMRNANGSYSAAVCIYLRKGIDVRSDPKRDLYLKKEQVRGYAISREYYEPDYTTGPPKEKDLRSTLLWKPLLVTGGKQNKITIPFYNNDVSKRLKLVLQGMDEAGQWIYVEKWIE